VILELFRRFVAFLINFGAAIPVPIAVVMLKPNL
jgi:hypothetical protein